MAKLVILTLEYREAKALFAAADRGSGNIVTPELREALRKLQQQMLHVNPLEKRNGKAE